MIVLGIETSCDETATAVYRGDVESGRGEIIAEQVASQIKTHARFGGVVPEVASREHLQLLPPMVDALLQECSISLCELDAIAVTAGPGLMGALLVGVSYARALGEAAGIPVIPVHHMEGHLLAPGLSEQGLSEFPFISLLASGGHTLLVRVDGVGQYQVIGQTIDDAVGECLDKSARLLGLAYPGGPEIAKLALSGDSRRYRFPRPMLNRDSLDFSFSGLKTAVMYKVRELGVPDAKAQADIAVALEEAVVDVLVRKCMAACRREGVPRLVIGGGVTANQRLRTQLYRASEQQKVQLYLPPMQYCTDNAAMIAFAASLRLGQRAQLNEEWDVNPRWRLGGN